MVILLRLLDTCLCILSTGHKSFLISYLYQIQYWFTLFFLQIMKSEDGKSKGFGFVSFESPEEAMTACDELNGKYLF